MIPVGGTAVALPSYHRISRAFLRISAAGQEFARRRDRSRFSAFFIRLSSFPAVSLAKPSALRRSPPGHPFCDRAGIVDNRPMPLWLPITSQTDGMRPASNDSGQSMNLISSNIRIYTNLLNVSKFLEQRIHNIAKYIALHFG